MQTKAQQRRNLLTLNTHFVWATANRLPLIGSEHERPLYRFIEAVFERYEATVLAIGGMPDHVHILASLSPKFGISEVVKNVKGSSSRFFSQSIQPGAWFEWQPNYGAIHVSPRDVEMIKQCILHQKQHHAKSSYLPEYEEVDEPRQ